MKKDYRHLAKTTTSIVNGRWTQKTEIIKVEVMAIVGNYAMVRLKGCAPFICSKADLSVDYPSVKG